VCRPCAVRIRNRWCYGRSFLRGADATYDVGVFVRLPPEQQDNLTPLSEEYDWARRHGIRAEAKHLMIEGVSVQFLSAYSPVVEEAIATARVHDDDRVPVRVDGPEHLVAMARGRSLGSAYYFRTATTRKPMWS
jgi:hypothetical protein